MVNFPLMTIPQPEQPARGADESAGLLLARLGRGAMEMYREALLGTGLKPPHVAVLVGLRLEPVGQQALGEATGLDPVRLVGILNDLEAAGLVERRRDAVDRRRHIVAITRAGRLRLDDVERASALADERLLAGLDPAQRRQLAHLLQLVAGSSDVAETCPGATDPEPGDCGAA
jgi:DNA-binding MarR family transcriptional regulator